MSDDEGFLTPQRIVFVSVCIVALGLGFQLAKFMILEPARQKQLRAAQHVADLDIPDTKVSKLTVEEREKQVALDKKTLEQLQKEGDKLEKPRKIEHMIRFGENVSPEPFIEWAKVQGYEVLNPQSLSKHARTLIVSRTSVPKLEEVSKHSLELYEGAKKNGGGYGGWIAEVVKE